MGESRDWSWQAVRLFRGSDPRSAVKSVEFVTGDFYFQSRLIITTYDSLSDTENQGHNPSVREKSNYGHDRGLCAC